MEKDKLMGIPQGRLHMTEEMKGRLDSQQESEKRDVNARRE